MEYISGSKIFVVNKTVEDHEVSVLGRDYLLVAKWLKMMGYVQTIKVH